MYKHVNTDDFAKTIADILNNWTEDKQTKIEEYTKQIADNGKTKLRETNMSSVSGGRDWNIHYSKNWSIKNRSKNNCADFFIYNKKTYRLTHLLEKGHITRNGGKTKSFVHIKPIQEWCNEEYEKGVERILKGEDND